MSREYVADSIADTLHLPARLPNGDTLSKFSCTKEAEEIRRIDNLSDIDAYAEAEKLTKSNIGEFYDTYLRLLSLSPTPGMRFGKMPWILPLCMEGTCRWISSRSLSWPTLFHAEQRLLAKHGRIRLQFNRRRVGAREEDGHSWKTPPIEG